ncbi:hypothetical protein [Mycoavidus cysteinexigens]|nr:hypothetical protein [Mycoavidus cysteinexigens]
MRRHNLDIRDSLSVWDTNKQAARKTHYTALRLSAHRLAHVQIP